MAHRYNSSISSQKLKLGSYKLIFDFFTTWQQGEWCLTADISKIRRNNSMVPNFVMKVDHTL